MGYLRAEPGTALYLNTLLSDGETGKFVRAEVRNSLGAPVTGSPFSLTHVAGGLYTNTAFTPLTEGVYYAIYTVYDDALFTIPSVDYGKSQDTFDVVAALDNASLQAFLGIAQNLAGSIEMLVPEQDPFAMTLEDC